ncbi:MAG: BMP family ABC transporter substrate-binding protein [Desulfobacteraceae bacterium]|nr:BMP family ABC transporter substrate-binding protein [Desulfobacteraceae bacterium]
MSAFKKVSIFLLILLFISVAFLGCGKKEEEKKELKQKITVEPGQEKKSVDFTVGAPIQDGFGDRSFSEMTYIGLIKAKKDYGIKLIFDVGHQATITEPEREAAIQRLIDKKVDLIAASGWQFLNAFTKMAKLNPKQHFLLNDVPMKNFSNIVSPVYAQHEGSFLAGCLAGWMTKTDAVGFIGAVDLTVIHAFRVGYTEGVKYANPKAKVFHAFVTTGNDFSGFEKPEEGFRLATKQINQGADIIFHVAGGQTGHGVIQAAKKAGKFAIGVDIDEDHIAEGSVLTSMIKRVDITTYKEVVKALKGNFNPGVVDYGLANGGVSLSPMKYTKHLVPKKVLEDLKKVEAKIISGEIKVTDYLKENMK